MRKGRAAVVVVVCGLLLLAATQQSQNDAFLDRLLTNLVRIRDVSDASSRLAAYDALIDGIMAATPRAGAAPAPVEPSGPAPQQIGTEISESDRDVSRIASLCETDSDPYSGTFSIRTLEVMTPWGSWSLTRSHSKQIPQGLDMLALKFTNATAVFGLQAASDSDAKKLLVAPQDVPLERGSIEFDVIGLPADYFAAHAVTGLDIRLVGRNTNLILRVPATAVSGFLQGCRRLTTAPTPAPR